MLRFSPLVTRSTRENGLLLVIAYLGFISLGLPDPLIGVAWPSVREAFARQQSEVAWVFAGAGIGYFLSSVSTGRLLSWMKVGSLLALSSAFVAVGGLGHGLAPTWWVFAFCSVLHGLGSGAIDSGLNHYVARHFSARHMNWLHAFYSVGASLGPLIMTGAIAMNGLWRSGYLAVAACLAALTVLFAGTRRQWTNSSSAGKVAEASNPLAPGMGEALRLRPVKFQILLFFIYTGMEVGLGQWSFTILTESRDFAPKMAGLSVTAYWASIGVGRVLFGFVVERVGIDRLLRVSAVLAVMGTALFVVSRTLSLLALAMVGLALAPIYPCLMSRTPQRVGMAYSAHAIGFQSCAAMIGAVSVPSLAGLLGERFGLEIIAGLILGMTLAFGVLHEWLLRFTARERGPRSE
jgi:fucose permease